MSNFRAPRSIDSPKKGWILKKLRHLIKYHKYSQMFMTKIIDRNECFLDTDCADYKDRYLRIIRPRPKLTKLLDKIDWIIWT
jgi:hypothetical protein